MPPPILEKNPLLKPLTFPKLTRVPPPYGSILSRAEEPSAGPTILLNLFNIADGEL